MKRLLTALVLVPFALWTTLLAPYPVFALVVALIALVCYYEFTNLAKAHGIETLRLLGFGAGLAVLFLDPAPVTALVVIIMAAALRARDLVSSLPQSAATLLGVLYVFGAWRCALDLRPQSPYWVLFALAVNWFGDSAAFYAGRALGRHKLAPRISPAKSVEGSIASLLASVLFGLAFRYWMPSIGAWQVIVLSLVANMAGQLGDLAESAFKRGAGVKDSGTMLPGHGGWLDRLDSSLFSLPAVCFLLQWLYQR